MANKRLLIDGSRGIYVPNAFIGKYVYKRPHLWGISEEDATTLLNDVDADDQYWDAWDHVLNTAQYVDEVDVTWYLYQDEHGDLWAYSEYDDELGMFDCAV